MPEIEKDIWITKDGRHIPINEMEATHLASAFLHCCTREFSVFSKINILYSKLNTMTVLKEKLIKAAELKGIKLQYPDEKFPSNQWGNYFEAERKVKTMQPEMVSTEHS